jgi:hypothetical protein
MHIADICYPESYLRTPMYELPFPQGTGEVCEVAGPIVEEESGYGYVRGSVEHLEQTDGWQELVTHEAVDQMAVKERRKRGLEDGVLNEEGKRKKKSRKG